MSKSRKEPFTFNNYFWYYLNLIDRKEDIPDWIWRKIKKIAKSMCEIDFSESKSKLIENLLTALHTSYDELKQFSTLIPDMQFLMKCRNAAIINHKGSIDNLFKSGEIIKYGKIEYKGDNLSSKFYRTLEKLRLYNEISTEKDNKIPIYQLEILLPLSDDSIVTQEVIEEYLRELNYRTVQERIRNFHSKKIKK